MMKRRLRPVRVVPILVFLALQSCNATRDPPVENKPASTLEATTVAEAYVPAALQEDKPRLSMERPPVSYLEEIIPPCTPIEGSTQNPCRPGYPPHIKHLSLAHAFTPIVSVNVQPSGEISVEQIDTLGATIAMSEFPTIEDLMLGEGQFISRPHIVIRGTVIPNTTRCEKYPGLKFPSGLSYYCFVDVRVNEYLAGIGPAQLTIGIYRDRLSIANKENPSLWELISNEWLERFFETPAVRTEARYGGKELILFLDPSGYLESWDVEGVAFLEPDAGVGYLYLNGLVERRSLLGIQLSELAHQIKEIFDLREAYELREEIWEELGAENRYSVTDANKLKDFYMEGTVELPPPVPVPIGS